MNHLSFHSGFPCQEPRRLEAGVRFTPETILLDQKYSPGKFTFGRFYIPDSLGQAEHEDIAARFLHEAVKRGQFVALSSKKLLKTLALELDDFQMKVDRFHELSRNFETISNPGLIQSLVHYVRRKIDGVYPDQQLLELSRLKLENAKEAVDDCPHSPMNIMARFSSNRHFFDLVIRDMIQNELLVSIDLKEEEGDQFFVPTEKMLDLLGEYTERLKGLML